MLTRRNMLVLTGFAGMLCPGPALGEDRIAVVATFSILSDLVKNIGGQEVEVATLVGPNANVHVYSPTPADAVSLTAAKVVFVNGLGLEGWITRLISASGTKAAKVIVSNGVKPLRMEDAQHPAEMAVDPHAWQSVANAKIYVANIRDGLSSVDPANKTIYDTNAKSYLGRLDTLEAEVREVIARIPRDRRKIITSHHSFGYFADAYGLEFISPEGVATEAEPSAKVVANIIEQIKRQKIHAVFLENSTDPRLVQQIANETGAKIGGTLYSDALSEPNGPAGSYIDMMRNNIRQFEKALMS
jgi:zinc/manganese transport system substrate-binding protein